MAVGGWRSEHDDRLGDAAEGAVAVRNRRRRILEACRWLDGDVVVIVSMRKQS